MKKILFFLFLSWNISGLIAQDVPSAVSLDEAIEWGMIHNRTMQRADMELKKAQKQKWETLSIGFPQITANLNYQNNIEQPVSLIPAEFFGGPAGEFSEITFGTEQTAMGMIELKQLLFDGTYVVGVQGIKHFLALADNAQEKTQLEIQRIIVDAYLGAIAARANVMILEDNTTYDLLRIIQSDSNTSKYALYSENLDYNFDFYEDNVLLLRVDNELMNDEYFIFSLQTNDLENVYLSVVENGVEIDNLTFVNTLTYDSARMVMFGNDNYSDLLLKLQGRHSQYFLVLFLIEGLVILKSLA